MSNVFDRVDSLVHFKHHITIVEFIISKSLFFVINSLQKQSFLLNPIFRSIHDKSNPYNLLWLRDVGGTSSESVDDLKKDLEAERNKMKKPTNEEYTEYSKIRAGVTVQHSNRSGVIPKQNLQAYKDALFEATKHIFNAEHIEAYNNKKRIEKAIKTGAALLGKLERIRILYEVGYSEAPAIHFVYFMDFRGRVYAEGFPVGLQNGYFKHILQPAKPSKLKTAIKKENSQQFKAFFCNVIENKD